MPHPRIRRSLSVACAIAFAADASIANASAAADTLRLPPAPTVRSGPPGPVAAKSVITPSDVDRQLGNLGDLLQRTAGLHVVRTGGIGDYLGVSLRGSSEQQVNVYVDGILRNQASDPSLFLSDWDLSRVERVEVYKGLAPENLPGSPMGGAINIVTRGPDSGSRARAAMGAGSFGSLRANGSAEMRAGSLRGRVEAARNQSDGDFPYYDDNGAEFKPGRFPGGAPRLEADDLTRKIRRNNAHGFTQIAAEVSFAPSAWEAGGQVDLTRLHKQIPAPNPNIDSTVEVSAFRESDRAFLRGYGRWSSADAEGFLDVSGTYMDDAYVDTSKGVGTVGLGYDDDRNVYKDLLASLWGRKILGGGMSISALASYGASIYHFTDRIRGREYPGIFRYTGEAKLTPEYTAGRHGVQAMLAATLSLQEHHADRIYAYGGARMPHEDWENHESLRLGYQFRVREGFWFSAQAGSAYRVPTFQEKFGDRGALVANPSLQAESAFNGSLGLHAATPRYSAGLEAFATQGRNIIALVQNSQYVMVYRNTNATRIYGLESKIAAAPRHWTRSEADLTLQKASSLSASGSAGEKLIPYRPTVQLSMRQSLIWREWTIKGTGYYQGLAYPNAANLPSIFDSYSHNTEWQARADLELSWRSRHWMAAAAVRNLLDQSNFDFFNYPLPGRTLAATLQVEL